MATPENIGFTLSVQGVRDEERTIAAIGTYLGTQHGEIVGTLGSDPEARDDLDAMRAVGLDHPLPPTRPMRDRLTILFRINRKPGEEEQEFLQRVDALEGEFEGGFKEFLAGLGLTPGECRRKAAIVMEERGEQYPPVFECLGAA